MKSSINIGLNLSAHTLQYANLYGVANDHDYLAKSLYQSSVDSINNVNEAQRMKIEQQTRGQSSTKVWFEARKSRITASRIKEVITAMRTSITKNAPCSKVPAKFNFKTQDLSNIPPVAWGRSQEPEAFKAFIEQYTGQKHFSLCGLFIDKSRNFLAASPDGICCCGSVILEIKCPYSIRNDEPTKAKFLDENGNLLKTHKYFYQVQFQLHTSNARLCHFIVYTTVGIHHCDVVYETLFMEDQLKIVDQFYKNVFCEVYCQTFGF